MTCEPIPNSIPWVEESNILSSIFSLTHLPAPHLQSEADIQKFLSLFRKFKNENQSSHLHSFVKSIETIEHWHLKWFPGYGAALHYINDDTYGEITKINVLSLDQWTYTFHQGSTEAQFGAKCNDFFNLAGVEIPTQNSKEFDKKFKKFFDKAVKRSGSERRADSEHIGHQKTPSFIHSALKEAERQLSEDEHFPMQPRGGFTDVGQHTGANPRDTAFPLVCSAIETALEFDNEITVTPKLEFTHGLIYFKLWLLERQLERLSVQTASIVHLASVAEMLKSIVGTASDPDLERHPSIDLEDILQRCQNAKRKIDDYAQRRAKYISKHYDLSSVELEVNDILKSCDSLSVSTPFNHDETGTDDCSIQGFRELAKTNLNAIRIFSDDNREMEPMLGWINEKQNLEKKRDILFSLDFIYFMEKTLFNRMKTIRENTLSEEDIKKLFQLVQEYQKHIDILKNSQYNPLLKTELLSRETLMIWGAFCLVHSTCAGKHSDIKSYDIPLNYKDLRYLVLSRKVLWDIVTEICQYIQSFSDRENPKLFSTSSPQGTFTFADTFVEYDPYIKTKIESVREYEEREKQKHWDEVKEKKERLANARNRRDELENWYYRGYTYFAQLDQAEKEVTRLKRPPTPVIQPLPVNDEFARQVAFFAYMPQELQLLAELTCMSQDVIFPEVPKKSYNSDMVNHFFSHSGKSRPSSYCHLNFLSTSKIPDQVGPSDLDQYSSPDQGIWHPDSFFEGCLGYSMYEMKDPFLSNAQDNKRVAQRFTELLPDEVQFAMETVQFNETETPRGNVAIANQYEHAKKVGFNFPEYLAFGSLRAFPRQQLRKLCACIRERSLPFNSDLVRTLIKMIMYNIGEIEIKNETVSFDWKHDMEFEHLDDVMYTELKKFVEEISFSPRRYESLLSLLEITNFFADVTSNEIDEISRDFSRVTLNFAEQLESQIDANQSGENTISLRTKQCLFYMYSVLSFENNKAITKEDVREMCKRIVLVQEKMAFDSKIEEDQNIRRMKVKCQKVIISHIANIVDKIDDDILYSTVNIVLHRIPKDLKWERIGSTSCFEAISSDEKELYSVNLMNGIVLLNGLPPTSLSQSIRSHSLFKRSFGEMNFQTVRLSSGELKTVKTINGNYDYTFKLNGDKLIIKEREYNSKDDTDPSHCLELLEPEGSWSSGLTVRLRKMYGHWICRDQNLILFRGVLFSERTPDFLLNLEDGDDNRPCYHIPLATRSKIHWSDFLKRSSEFYQLLVAGEKGGAAKQILNVLGKFENVEFIHMFISPDGKLIEFSLPRYQLQFRKSGNQISSKQHKGYHLALDQQMTDSLREFTQYLVLEKKTEDYESCMHAKRVILIPKGTVETHQDSIVFIQADERHDARREYYKYELHSHLNVFQASNTAARLQLAAIYSACSTGIPEPCPRITAIESSMHLVRQCWQNEPFQKEELKCLLNIFEYDFKGPSLPLLCYELLFSSQSVAFLHGGKEEEYEDKLMNPRKKIDDWKNAYTSLCKDNAHNNRLKLNSEEEKKFFGRQIPKSSFLKYNRDWKSVDLEKDFPLPEEFAQHQEQHLKSFVASQDPNCREEFPIEQTQRIINNLEIEMIEELRESWDFYQELPKHYRNISYSQLRDKVKSMEEDVNSKKKEIEEYIIESIEKINKFDCSWTSKIYILRKNAFLEPSLSFPNLIRVGWDDSNLFSSLNPFLSDNAKTLLSKCSLVWMQLIILQDKLIRIKSACQEEKDEHLIKELRAERTWNVQDHRTWLAFEVESRLQIRPEQYTIAKYLIDNPRAITQLNMGQGKTRVILPMLALYYSSQQRSNSIIRLNLLSQLLLEAKQYLHKCLYASTLGIKIFTVPFHRQIQLTPEYTRRIHQTLVNCKNCKGLLLIAPEHRLSLSLKRYDIDNLNESENEDSKNSIQKTLAKIEKMEYKDIFDEADEVLDYKFQLRYAVGDHQPLSSGTSRWHSAEALLELFHVNQNIRSFLQVISSVCIRRNSEESCALDETVFINPDKFKQFEPELNRKLAEELLNQPPYELRWLKKIQPHQRNSYIKFIVESEAKMPSFPEKVNQKAAEDDLLALRGMLAFSVLSQCLQKRWEVNYGIARKQERFKLKRMAVPFRATGTPSLRAEFAHPDVLIVLTLLSYYYTGLTRNEIKETLRELLKKGEREQEKTFNAIFELSKPDIRNESDRKAIDQVRKIDLSNEQQLILIHQYMNRNIYLINFFLNNCIFENGTQQYPQRIETSAWNLTDHNSRGFSGTNDNHRLLPLQVKQHFLKYDRELIATNGKMLSLVLKNQEIETIPTNDESFENSKPLWQKILDRCLDNNAQALIDAGALMAGTTEKQIYQYFLKRTQDSSTLQWRGIVFFTSGEGWKIATRDSISVLHQSPTKEREAFVYFDENHCRGADMKLQPDALGIMTIGPNTTKDKLMQAAGRMRQLDAQQKIKFALIPPIKDRINALSQDQFNSSDGLNSKQLLQYVIHNTMEATKNGIVQWAYKGFHYSNTSKSDEFIPLDEKIDLETLYGKSSTPENLKENLIQKKEEFSRIEADYSLNVDQEMVQEIEEKANALVHSNVSVNNTDEECERETQRESEREQQVESEVLKKDPLFEKEWNFQMTLGCSSITSINNEFDSFCHLSDFVEQCLPKLKPIKWNKTQIYVTQNFTKPVHFKDNISRYLRPIDAMLVYPDGAVLLLSEFEAEWFLKDAWNQEFKRVWFVNYCYARDHYTDPSHPPPLAISNSRETVFYISHKSMAALQLFDGETKFQSDSLCKALQSILDTDEAKNAARELPRLRHTTSLVRKSQLESIIEGLY
eukprot:gb/GECH01006961.1/.p1 GENE.gb/GECH01006961.1/~~gb/GECH01006961.1/.p1  ORF type:complete len:2802 (+),score=553.19 gb/GECH01006961.1/:1-8406(+)